MDRHAQLQAMRSVVMVQQVRLANAEGLAVEAARLQAAADDAAAKAGERSDAASADWQDHVGGEAHDPAYGRWLAERLIARSDEADSARGEAERSARLADQRRQERQEADGRLRSSTRSLKKLSAKVTRRREEKRLERLADRVTYQWVKR